MQKFLQGATNHIAWVMVDATDFATPESAMSAATVIRIYGKVNTAAGVNFVSSGTGSLTNDIVHVGASATGIYTIALAAADLSDASQAWYDMYIVHLSATGAARQTLIASGVRTDTSYMSNILSYLSNIVSNIDSALAAGTFLLGASNLSDIGSRVWADTIGTRVDSRLLLVQSRLSDLDSRLTSDVSDILSSTRGNSDALSDLRSLLTSASFLSDIASQVWAARYTANSAASSFGSLLSDIYSRLVLTQSAASDAASGVSDLRSLVTSASFLSDIASQVWAHAVGTRVDSRILLIQSDAQYASNILSNMSGILSDTYSLLSDTRSTMDSQFAVVSNYLSNASNYLSTISAIASDAASAAQSLRSAFIGATGSTASAVADASALEVPTGFIDHNDQFNGYYLRVLGGSQVDELRLVVDTIKGTSRIIVKPAFASRLASGVNFMLLAGNPWQSLMHSDIMSRVSDVGSDLRSYLVGLSGTTSDLYSLLSDLQSDFQSRVTARVATSAALSDVHSDLRSFLMVMSGVQSDIYSALSDFQSDFGSRVPKRVATDSQLSDLHSDLRSFLAVMSGIVSDTYSALSDLQSDFQSRVPKRVATDSQLSDVHSDLRSQIAGITATVSASDISDIASAVRAILSSDLSDILSAAVQINSRVLVNQSRVSDIYSLLSDVASDVTVMSGVQSDIYSLLSDLDSDFDSRIPATLTELASVPGATPTLRQVLMLEYQFLRNNTTGTPTRRQIRNAAGTIIGSGVVAWNAATSVFEQGALG